MKIKELNAELLKIMPANITFEWDNVGLLIGDGKAEIGKVLLTLDVTSKAVDKAIKEKCNLILSHHPLIFGKIDRINNPLYLKLIRAGIDVICMHTNLDSIKSGVNRILAEKLGLSKLSFISSEGGNKVYWCKVFIPSDYFNDLKVAVTDAGGGLYERYDACYVSHEVQGSFNPNEDATPAIGYPGAIELVDEMELQFRVDKANLNRVISAIKAVHPYETPVYHFYEITDDNINYGSGMVGDLASEITLEDFARLVKDKLQAPFVKLWTAGKSSSMIKRVSVCGGSGSFLINKASAISDVIVTGDVTYHTMLDSSLPIIDAGHFYTENPVLEYLSEIIKQYDIQYFKLTPQEHEISNLKLI
ncbi:Nif3-like dinuclear metal center hexameric protein [bacterium]|nr:Nif3-like dinuclear metal center hexameric protein [bacterium]